ncbi:MAG: BON domain-containing protein [Gammaproteobacteria bacterium]|nr:BON domain-containing protein [Gammaproteobacteria bacterium]
MMKYFNTRHLYVFVALLFAVAACGQATEQGNTPAATDEQLKLRIESAVERAEGVPQQINVAVQDGIVSISGSLACDDCAGLRTPATTGTLQQSLGAVVRAVPGVREVKFSLVER